MLPTMPSRETIVTIHLLLDRPNFMLRNPDVGLAHEMRIRRSVTSYESMQCRYTSNHGKPPAGSPAEQGSIETQPTENVSQSGANDCERDVPLFFVWLLQWGTRNNRAGIDRPARNA